VAVDGDVDDELVELETQGWEALQAGGEEARAFYDEVLDDHVLMLLPGGLVLDDRAAILEGFATAAPWAEFRLEAARVLPFRDDGAIVAYEVVARRDGSPEYSALVSSGYVRRAAGWRLAFHQQTPR
jgi:hypothetical protein